MIRRLALLGILGVFGTLAVADSAEACHRRRCGHRTRTSCYSTTYSGGGSCYSSQAEGYAPSYPGSYAAPSYPAPSGQSWTAPAPSPQAGNWQAAPNKVPPAPMMAPMNRAAAPVPSFNSAPAGNPVQAPAPAAGGLQGAVPPPPAPPSF